MQKPLSLQLNSLNNQKNDAKNKLPVGNYLCRAVTSETGPEIVLGSNVGSCWPRKAVAQAGDNLKSLQIY